ncbi:MAG: hypothetical protein RQ729_07960 [Wenzhouxiangellaceae bacterium]|nr:hypothetical protein [Wenzhouxiangellaceae bacterium]
MNLLRVLPAILSFWLLAAHFYRAGWLIPSALCALLPLLLLLRRDWVPRLLQALLVLGALEWLRTLYGLALMRMAFDMPWARLGLILGAVALFALFAAVLFETRALKRRYRRELSSADR